MSSPDPWLAVRARIEAGGLGVPIAWPNEPIAEPDPVADPPPAWIVVEMSGALTSQIEIGAPGSNTFQEDGMIWGHVMVPTGTGSLAARQLAKRFANLFRGASFGDVTCTDASIGMGEAGDETGNWWRLSVSVDYRFQDR